MYIAQPKTNSLLGSHFSHGCAILSGGLFLKGYIMDTKLQKEILDDCKELLLLLQGVPTRGDNKGWWRTLEKARQDIAKAEKA